MVTELQVCQTKQKKERIQIINFSSESSLAFPSCWKSIIFIWQWLSIFFFPLWSVDSAQNKICKVTSVRFTTSVIILCMSCDPLKPSHHERRQQIWPLQKLCSFDGFLCCFSVHDKWVTIFWPITHQIRSYNSLNKRSEMIIHVYIWKTCFPETGKKHPGKQIATCFICLCLFSLCVFMPSYTICLSSRSFCCRQYDQ